VDVTSSSLRRLAAGLRHHDEQGENGPWVGGEASVWTKGGNHVAEMGGLAPDAQDEANVALIVHARNSLPELADVLEAAADELDAIHTALAEADVPRSEGVDEPLFSDAHRVRLLRERAERAESRSGGGTGE
jgi:hypothetical protein